MLEDKAAPGTLAHPKNITVGKGRVIYAPMAVDISGRLHEEGWVLPGGARTRNEVAAHAAARAINAMSGAR